jgi:hypothetical protein
VVGVSVVGGAQYATEWSDGVVINLGSLANTTDSVASRINDVEHGGGGVSITMGSPLSGTAATPILTLEASTASLASLRISMTLVKLSDTALALTFTPPSGTAAALSVWELFRVSRVALPGVLMTPDRWWDGALALPRPLRPKPRHG